MSSALRLFLNGPLQGHIGLTPSKSISNRALIIQSFCDDPMEIQRLSQGDDTRFLQNMLAEKGEVLFAGHAGTSYRFMLARACLFNRPVVLDGSAQLRKRPVGPLVRALQKLGADIAYLGREGFPPVRISPSSNFGQNVTEVTLSAGVSSQFISALMMIGPAMPKGIRIHLEDEIVSASYIEMTLQLMRYFGAKVEWKDQRIDVQPGLYTARDYTVEGDWSAASYFYSMLAIHQQGAITIDGLTNARIQGDAICQELFLSMGVTTTFTDTGIQLAAGGKMDSTRIETVDFRLCPDIAQTWMVTLGGMGWKGKLKGLQTLHIKETDRLSAMQRELQKVKVNLEYSHHGGDVTAMIAGKAHWKGKGKFDTYDDHRMAMSLAALSVIDPIVIRDPNVVSKSYPEFWDDLKAVNIGIVKVSK